jgi:hypothetical protein
MALPLPDYGDASETRGMAERDHLRETDRVRPSGLVWLAILGIAIVLVLLVRAAF